MYHDPDFMPFQPPIGRSGPFDYVRNYIETLSASTYVGGSASKGYMAVQDTLFVTEPSVIGMCSSKRPELLGRDLATIQAMSNFLASVDCSCRRHGLALARRAVASCLSI